MFRSIPHSRFDEDCFLAEGPLRISVRRRSNSEGDQHVQLRVLLELTEDLPIHSTEVDRTTLEMVRTRLRDYGCQLLRHSVRLKQGSIEGEGGRVSTAKAD